VLGYFLPLNDTRLETFLTAARSARVRRGEQMVDKLQQLGVDIDLAEVTTQAGTGALGRPHVARALMETGAVANFNEAFTRFLGRGRPAYVEKPLPPLRQVTELLHTVGGVAVAAHLGDHGTERQLRELREQGLDGIEIRHPSHTAGTEARLKRLAQALDLGISGGSDWHGETEYAASHAPLGGMDVPEQWLHDLEQRRPTT
jgi:predicted metal-dependent phosphoesterase TrpH